MRLVLQPAAKSLGFEVTFYSLRRGWQRETNKDGSKDDRTQGVMRRCIVGPSTDSSSASVAESLRCAIEELDEQIRLAVKALSAPPATICS